MLGICHRTRPPLCRPRYSLVSRFGLHNFSITLLENIGLPSLAVKVSLDKNEPFVKEAPIPATRAAALFGA